MTFQELLKLLERGYREILQEDDFATTIEGLRLLMGSMDMGIDEERATYMFRLGELKKNLS